MYKPTYKTLEVILYYLRQAAGYDGPKWRVERAQEALAEVETFVYGSAISRDTPDLYTENQRLEILRERFPD